MGRLHDLIEEHGRQAVLERLGPSQVLELDGFIIKRPVVETAARFLADSNLRYGHTYSGWCQTVLPHRSVNQQSFKYEASNGACLLVHSMPRTTETGIHYPGIPFGSRARLILFYLQSQAIKNRSRVIEVEDSLYAWLKALGIPVGGNSYVLVRDQSERIAHCDISFTFTKDQRTTLVWQRLVDAAIFQKGPDGYEFTKTVMLSEAFYQQLREYKVMLPERSIKALSNNSMALDVFGWLAYRLWTIRDGGVAVSWMQLHDQFGKEYTRRDNFVMRFRDVLQRALAVYPDAKVELVPSGIILKRSSPPVPRPTVIAGFRATKEAKAPAGQID